MLHQSLQGKVAIVTGAARNIGGESAKALADQGAKVVLHYHSDSSKAEAEGVATSIRNGGGEAMLVQADLTDLAQIERLFAQAVDKFGRIDILLNTVGTMLKKPASEVTEAEFDKMFNVHTKTTFFLLREAAKSLQDNGRIINISTTLTSATTGLYSVYAGAKAATEQFTKMLAKEIGSRGITVNSIAPGPLNTSFFYPVENEHSIEYLKHMSVQNRLGEVAEVVPVVSFLASPEANWVTAQTIRVNGGML